MDFSQMSVGVARLHELPAAVQTFMSLRATDKHYFRSLQWGFRFLVLTADFTLLSLLWSWFIFLALASSTNQLLRTSLVECYRPM